MNDTVYFVIKSFSNNEVKLTEGDLTNKVPSDMPPRDYFKYNLGDYLPKIEMKNKYAKLMIKIIADIRVGLVTLSRQRNDISFDKFKNILTPYDYTLIRYYQKKEVNCKGYINRLVGEQSLQIIASLIIGSGKETYITKQIISYKDMKDMKTCQDDMCVTVLNYLISKVPRQSPILVNEIIFGYEPSSDQIAKLANSIKQDKSIKKIHIRTPNKKTNIGGESINLIERYFLTGKPLPNYKIIK